MWLNNKKHTQKMHLLPVSEVTSDSLSAVYVEPHHCPWHQLILLFQEPISEIFAKKICCFIPMKISQHLKCSKDGSRFDDYPGLHQKS